MRERDREYKSLCVREGERECVCLRKHARVFDMPLHTVLLRSKISSVISGTEKADNQRFVLYVS